MVFEQNDDGVPPFNKGEEVVISWEPTFTFGLRGDEVFELTGITELNSGITPKQITVKAGDKTFSARLRIDTPGEADYYRHGGIMQYVLRSLLA